MPVATASTGGLVFYVFIDSVSCIAIIIINAKINYKNQFTPIKGAVFSVSTLSKTTLYQCIIQKKG